MDGSYGNVFQPKPSGMSPMSPMSPNTSMTGGGQYKANVNRQKTKKWVEAKVQNYDGDDWGNDYEDEEPEEPVPPPPMRHMGPRSPASPPLPSTGQQPPPMSRPFQTPASPAYSPPLRTSSGALPLHIQTQTGSPLPSRPSSSTNPAVGEHITSPQSTNVPRSASPSVQHGYASPVFQAQRRMSPAPQNTAAPAPGRFPPRKSSMGQQDSTEFTDSLRQPGSGGSRPDSGHKPWMEARPASPSSAKSPTTSGKQLPFIRPSDIYKRMEDQEKERRSMDSGRLSTDGASAAKIDSPSKTQHEPVEAARRTSPAIDDGAADASRSMRPSLAPVAERKSEYGLEGLIDSYGAPESEAPPPVPAPVASMAPAVAPTPAEPPTRDEADEPEAEDDVRRFSTSPKLPDLARMSTFGMDFFSGSSSFLSDAPSTPAIPSTVGPSGLAEGGSAPTGLQSLAEENEDGSDTAVAKEAPLQSSALGVSQPTGTSLSSRSSPLNSGHPSPAQEHPPSAAPPEEEESSVSSTAASHSATSGVVSAVGETAQPEAPVEATSEPVPEPSPLVEENTSHQSSPLETVPILSSQAAGTGGPAITADHTDTSPPSEVTEGSGDSEASAAMGQSQSAAADVKSSMTVPSSSARPVSPSSLPPLRTSTPSSSSPKDGNQPPSTSNDEPSHQQPVHDSPGAQTSSGFTPVTMRSDITPTAPLNPHRGSVVSMEPPPRSLERINTMSTVTTASPVKESDKLREEIIKSLSPVLPGGDFGDLSARDPSKAAEGMAGRESSYLPDLYDDYWASSDEKPENDTPEVPEVQAAASSGPAESSPALKDETSNVAVVPTSPEAPVSSPQTEAVAQPDSGVRRRFSWEAGSERVNLDSPASDNPGEPKSIDVTNPPAVAAAAAAATATAALSVQAASGSGPTSPAASQHSAPGKTGAAELGSPTSGTGTNPPTISHQVSLASTLPPQSDLAPPQELPSPLSVVSSDRRGTPANETKRLSLAEEKSLAEASGSPLFPAPAPEQHPALSQTSLPLPSPRAAANSIAAKKDALNIVPFRQIIGMPSPSERIKLFNETREQFAGTDQGLQDWLLGLRAQHGEYANATAQFNDPVAAVGGAPGAGQQQGSQQGAQQPQQPYYQQYLSASSSNLVGTQGGQRPMSNLPAPPQQYGTSGFGHSGNQVGQKSKVLLMAAGKAGKGLLSKGKSKLKGSGEKVFF